MLFPVLLLASIPASAAPPDFDRSLAPLFIKRCIECHGPTEPKGGLDLTTKKTVVGLDEESVVVPGKLAMSRLWERVSIDEMPPKHPLSPAEKAVFKSWIESGANWGRDPIDPLALSTSERGGRDWWALQPLKPHAVPANIHPVDHFVAIARTAKGLSASVPADPRTLVRRLYFDLIGLPPSPETIEAYAKNPSDEAYFALVDKLLASPQYGERWARHWLDLVRYGESDGFERNAPRPNAWHYRDFVIAAFNADMPFDQFARWQIAGDILQPDEPAAIQATGFLVAGIHNTVLGSNAISNATARQDEIEDILAAVGQTFLGLTVQCARCHDHKFDAITQVDYYRFAAALGGVNHGERVAMSADTQRDRQILEKELKAKLAVGERSVLAIEAIGRERANAKLGVRNAKPKLPIAPLARWSFDGNTNDTYGHLNGTLKSGAKIEGGRLILDGKSAHVTTASLKADLKEKTLEVWLSLPTLDQSGGGGMTVESNDGNIFDSIVYAERQPKKWLAGSNSYRRTRDANGAIETAKPGQWVHTAISYATDGRIAIYRDGKQYGTAYTLPGESPVSFRTDDSHIVFGMRHTGGGKAFLNAEIDEARLYDRALTSEEIAASAAAGTDGMSVSMNEILASLTAEERATHSQLLAGRAATTAKLANLPAPTMVFAIAPKSAPPTYVLSRGNVEKPKAIVSAGGVASIPGMANFGLPHDAPEGLRRQKLAEWIARADNPAFTRTIVNRLWHHHFGIGLVDSPSDLGFNGGRPSHPELLDWLAAELVRQKFHLKPLHRLLVTSTTYRQSSAKVASAFAKDADNRLLWRMSPRRLEGEAIRDAMLVAAGKLNPKLGGPGYHDVRTYGDSGTLYYEPIDPIGDEFQRRTIYRFSPRGERSAILETFDCPDPSALTPRRQITTTPLQALALWNDSFVLRTSQSFAERIGLEGKGTSAQIDRAYRLSLGRQPSDEERKRAIAVVEKHGLTALCRVLFNCNEFVVME